MMSVTFFNCNAERHCSERHYAECHYPECLYAECRGVRIL